MINTFHQIQVTVPCAILSVLITFFMIFNGFIYLKICHWMFNKSSGSVYSLRPIPWYITTGLSFFLSNACIMYVCDKMKKWNELLEHRRNFLPNLLIFPVVLLGLLFQVTLIMLSVVAMQEAIGLLLLPMKWLYLHLSSVAC